MAVILLDSFILLILVAIVSLVHRVSQRKSRCDCEWQRSQDNPSPSDFVDEESRNEVTGHKCHNQKVVNNIISFTLFEFVEINIGVL